MTAPKLLAIIIVALYLQFYHTKVLLVQTHDGTNIAPKKNIKSRVASQIKTSKLKKKTGHHSIQNKALGLPADLLQGPDEKPGRKIMQFMYLVSFIYKLTQSRTFNLQIVMMFQTTRKVYF